MFGLIVIGVIVGLFVYAVTRRDHWTKCLKCGAGLLVCRCEEDKDA